MTVQLITGTFPVGTASGEAGCILQNHFNTATVDNPGWSAGAATSAQVAQATSIPPLSRATVLAWSVGAYLGYGVGGSELGFGKFGRIVAGLSRSAVPIIRGSTQPWSVALPGVPDDSSLTETMWDPSTDEMPPWMLNTSTPPSQALLPVSASQVLTTPLPLDPGALPYIAIWSWPSLLGISSSSGGTIGLSLLYGKWSVLYDDGTPTPQGLT